MQLNRTTLSSILGAWAHIPVAAQKLNIQHRTRMYIFVHVCTSHPQPPKSVASLQKRTYSRVPRIIRWRRQRTIIMQERNNDNRAPKNINVTARAKMLVIVGQQN